MRHFIKVFFLFVFMLTSIQCSKDNDNFGIPLVFVNLRLNVNNPSFFNLSVTGGWEYVAGGSRGILVYRARPNEFMAYDRHSTYNVEAGCRVEVDSTNFGVEDPCSGSRWSIFDGSVIQGPAAMPLKPYQTFFDGTFLTISN